MATKRMNGSKVPNLRFPEFDGLLMETSLENLCDRIGDGIHSTPMYNEFGDYYFVNGNNLIDGRIVITESTKKITKEEALKHNTKSLNENAILLSINGTIGNIALFRDEFIMLGKSACFLNPKPTVNRLFIFHSLRSKRIVNYYLSELTGTTIKNLSLKSIRATRFVLPSINEQKKITSFLSLIDERIETQNKIIEQLETLIKTISESLFSKELRFPEFNDEWKETKLKNECIINPKTAALKSEFIYIDLEAVVNGALVKKNNVKKSEAPSRAQRVLDDYDILFQCVRPYQQNNLLYRKVDDKQWVASTGYAQLKTQHSPSFFYYLLGIKAFNNEVVIRCTGTSYPAISSGDLGEIPISICSLKEQEKIATLLSLINNKVTVEKKSLLEYEIQRKYLLQSLFI
ncbi:restriction endonuclease subunit S [Mucilaginibacter sp.]|uniref:restriction endonuclease subunit S n=1 Tax=Mucilaginibacter sp. TaxID=1882438 RepID=UPI0032659342